LNETKLYFSKTMTQFLSSLLDVCLCLCLCESKGTL
jgi:hypothetical protein